VVVGSDKYDMNYDTSQDTHKIIHETTPEFEELRELCLAEDQWLGRNFEKDRLVIEDHSGFSLVFDKATGEPVVWGGVFNGGRYPANVARHCHRFYIFPKYRATTREGLIGGWRIVDEHIVKPLIAINNYDVYIMGMQNRPKKNTKGYWRVWCDTLTAAMPMWIPSSGYLQTCQHNVQQCWQNFVYAEQTPGAFAAWNPTTITHEEWNSLPLGTA